jgi:hypothetical protein
VIKGPEMIAHIYRASGGGYDLILTHGPDLMSARIKREHYPTLRAAKAAAKALGAKPWNF